MSEQHPGAADEAVDELLEYIAETVGDTPKGRLAKTLVEELGAKRGRAARGRTVRDQAASVQAEARAVRSQSGLQIRRAERLKRGCESALHDSAAREEDDQAGPGGDRRGSSRG